MQTFAPTKSRHVELILRQIDSLPTLPAIATRLLSLTASDESDTREVIELVKSDPALTSKILSQCRHADVGLRNDVMTIDRAVVMLGFNAVRNAVLSIKVFEVFEHPDKKDADDDGNGETNGQRTLDHTGFWRHSLAVAIAAELIAQQHPECPDLPPDEAFVCGLLHDVGKLALEDVLPKSYARIVELAELNHDNIAEFERRIIGIDHHTAGKRLAEQWGLPHRLQDCIWLHGSPYDMLPKLEHRRLIGLTSLADLVVRRHHLGYSGNFSITEDPYRLAQQLGLDPQVINSIDGQLHEQLEARGKMMGLNEQPSRELFLQSIHQANQALGRVNAALERRSQMAQRQQQVLEAVTQFHCAGAPARGMADVLDQVVASARNVLGDGYYAMLFQPEDGEAWQFYQYSQEGNHASVHVLEPPPHTPNIAELDVDQSMSVSLMGLLPWIADYVVDSQDIRQVRLLPLSCGWKLAAVMLHDRPRLLPSREMRALELTWGAAIAGSGQHDGARRLSEQLAESNRALAETQDKLLQTESLARLGEMAAGAAHEMNNPLTVISGRSQLLLNRLQPGSDERNAAMVIDEQSHRLSNLITSMRLIADPPPPRRKTTDVVVMMNETVEWVRQEASAQQSQVPIAVRIKNEMMPVNIDPEQISEALHELLLNAVQSSPRSGVHVTAQIEKKNKRLMIQVVDDGIGMDAYTLAHAKDPFFSAKAAGRRAGMGLARAQQFAAVHNGHIELRSSPGSGTIATLVVGLDSPSETSDE